MKKFIKYNIIIFTVLLFLFEACCYIKVYADNKSILENRAKCYDMKPFLTYYKMLYPSYEERKKLFKPVSIGTDKTKRPIALFGCSYTWGSFLNDEEIFSAVLSKYTGRTVYNRALYAAGAPFFYYQLTQIEKSENTKDVPSFYRQLKQPYSEVELDNPEYIIYTLIDSHFYRLLTIRSWCKDPLLQYRYTLDKNGNLKFVKPIFPQLYSLYSVFLISKFIQDYKYEHEEYKDVFIKLMIKSDEIIKQKFPGAEFVILVYQDAFWSYDKTKTEILKILEKNGIKIIYTDDLLGKNVLNKPEYIGEDGFHPSAKAWQLIVPLLSKELNL